MAERARIIVRLTPRGGRDEIQGWRDAVLRMRVAAPAVEGRANAAMLRLLAKALAVAPSRLRIVAGGHAREKTVEIEGMNTDAVRAALA